MHKAMNAASFKPPCMINLDYKGARAAVLHPKRELYQLSYRNKTPPILCVSSLPAG